MRIVLASESPRRLQLLQSIGFEVIVVPPKVIEEPLIGEGPKDMVLRLAQLKANAIYTVPGLPEGLPIIAADTIVCLDQIVLGKPKDNKDAARMLKMLSGRVHEVITGSIVKIGSNEKLISVTTEVSFRVLSEAQIDYYVKTGESLDKAGAYGIQGIAASLTDQIKGSYTNVMGLPVNEILQALKELIDTQKTSQKSFLEGT